MGIAYDSGFLGVLYFNYERTRAHFEKTFYVTNEDFRYFELLKQEMDPLPKELYPFFYSDFTISSFFTGYFVDKYNFGNEDFTEFIHRMSNEKDVVKNLFYEYIFKYNTQDIELLELIDRVSTLHYEEPLKYEIVKAISNFDKVFNILV